MPAWTYSALKAIGVFLYHIAPAIVGVLFGGWLVQRHWIRKANESSIIEYLAEELNDLVDDTLLYWSLDCSGTGKEAEAARKQAVQLAAKIKAGSHNLNVVLRSYSEKYCKKISFTSLWEEVHDACTGGNFESANRGADPHRFARVVNSTHRVRWQLFERRV